MEATLSRVPLPACPVVRSIFQTRNECSDGNLSGEPTRPVKWDTTFDHISRRKNSITTDLLRVGLPDRVFNSSSFHKTAETRGNNKAEMLEFLIKNGIASSDKGKKIALKLHARLKKRIKDLPQNYTYDEYARC